MTAPHRLRRGARRRSRADPSGRRRCPIGPATTDAASRRGWRRRHARPASSSSSAAGRPTARAGIRGPGAGTRSGRIGRRSDPAARPRLPTSQQALPWPARPPRDPPMSSHLTMVTRWPPSSADQDQAIYGWSTSSASLALVWPASARCDGGMTPGELAAVRGRLEEFAAEMFAPLARRDQRDKGATYVRGLLLDGRRKSMQPMAARLGVDHQGLQQFLSSSTWAVEPVRERLAHRAVEVIAPQAWVVDDTGFVKDGTASPGVARQYSGTLGKVGNCQIGVSICAVTDFASCPLNWRLFLPPGWDDREAATPQDAAAIRSRRARAAIPDEQRHRAKWRLALDMLDELAGWQLGPPGAVADAGYGNNADFRSGIDARGWVYVVAVNGDLTAFPAEAVPEVKPYSGRGRHPLPRYRTKPVGLRAHVLAAGRGSAVEVTWRQGSRGPMTSQFVALRVRPARRRPTRRLAEDGSLPAVWLLAEWPPEAAEPTDYWLSSLPADTDLAELVRLAKIRWRIEHDYRECKTALGLDHFEGRTFAGWHRHVTLVTAAQLFLTLLRTDPKAAAPA